MNHNDSKKPIKYKTIYYYIVLGILIISLFAIKIFNLDFSPPTPDVLTPSSSLIKFSSLEKAQKQTSIPIFLPAQFFSSNLETIGIYHQSVNNLPAESIITILSKDNWRFAEIIQKPQSKLEKEILQYPADQQEIIQLKPLTGILIKINPPIYKCFNPAPEKNKIGFCPITQKIVFVLNDQLIIISGNKKNISPGELISLARSIIEKNYQE